jgi:hypothetical protein
MKLKVLLTTAQAARQLEVTPSAVRKMSETGRLEPVAKIDGKTATFLYDPAHVKKLTVVAVRAVR